MGHNLVTKSSDLSVDEVVQQLKSLLSSKSIKLFAHIDHGAAAKESSMRLEDEQVLIFGDPRVGTNLMQEQPAIGIELPLKILIWSDGGTKIAYTEPLSYLEEFNIVRNKPIIEKMSALMSTLVGAVANQ